MKNGPKFLNLSELTPPELRALKVSGGTRNDIGRQTRDATLGRLKTCAKLGIAFWDYLGDRFGITPGTVPPLADIIRQRAEEQHALIVPAPA